MVALNIEGDISRKVARKGLDGLSEKEKEALPLEMDFSDSQYRKDILSIFRMHQGQHRLKTADFFLQSQTVWDEIMAETVHRFVSFHPETTLVVLAGNGHLRNKYGIPNRAFRRNGVPFTVIAQDEDLEPGIADYVLQTTILNGKKSPLLGVGIEETNKGVSIVSVLDNSPAGKAGLEKGDVITQMAGQTIRSLVDLKYELFYTTSGSTVAIQVDHNGVTVSRDVTLFDFKPHR
jgi:membrane-associated protease RseP (regulator of RpoE activity)